MTHPTNFLNRRAAIYDPGTHQYAPAAAVLRRMASQEHCDGEPYDTMVAVAEYLDHLEHTLAVYEKGLDVSMSTIATDEPKEVQVREVFRGIRDMLDTTALDRVWRERMRQPAEEGFDHKADDTYPPGVLMQAAVNYLVAAMVTLRLGGTHMDPSTAPPMNQMIGGEWPFLPARGSRVSSTICKVIA